LTLLPLGLGISFASFSAALSFQYVLTWEIASPLTYGYLSARWKCYLQPFRCDSNCACV